MIINGVYLTNDVMQMIDTTALQVFYLRLPLVTLPQRNSMVSTWNLPQKGRMWFNTTTKQVELWTGVDVRIIG